METYDKYNPLAIEAYAQRLIGKTFADVCNEDDMAVSGVVRNSDNYDESHADRMRKGGLGELIEERFFHYQSNSDSRPDFSEAGVELKVTPYRINRDGSLAAKERLIITMIDYFSVINESFESSHLWIKAQLILLIYYLYQQDAPSRLDYRIDFAKLFTPPEEDLRIIKHDFDVIVQKIRDGKAHELSEGDTLYLGAAPKAATSADRRAQPNSDELAKPRAFAFKNSYMTYVLRNYIAPGRATYERVLPSDTTLSFEEYVKQKIEEYKGWKLVDLLNKYHLAPSKSLLATLVYRILGIKGNHAEEFEKANLVIKTIRIGSNGKIKENMSFPAFRFNELVEEEWETSTFGTYLSETRFLFVVFQGTSSGCMTLKGCQFWNIPYEDLNTQVRTVWERTKRVLIDGLQVSVVNGRYHTNLPHQSDNPVCHVRPHAKNAQDTYDLPDGRAYPKQCFWLNNSYILSQIDLQLRES